MTKPYDPIAAQRAMLYSRQELESIFKGSGNTAQKLFLENPELYKTMRAEAVAQGLLGPSATGTPAPYTTGTPQKSYTDRELFLRAKYSLAELTTFFQSNKSNNAGNKENPSTLFRTNPAEYAERREAAVSYGLLPESPSTPQRTPQARTEPQPGSGETFELDPRICKELSLPEGFRVNQEGYYRAIQAVKNAAASKAVAAEKAEQAAKDAAANN